MIKNNVYLFIFVLVASCALITIDFYTIKILSGVRAYINGELEYSKGQKDALLYLYTYVETEDHRYKDAFARSISIPVADDLARTNIMLNNDGAATTNFLIAHNHLQDIPDMIWLLKTFRNSYMKEPIRLWVEAEPLIDSICTIGNNVDEKIKNKTISEEEKQKVIKQISTISTQLYQKESEFSQRLGQTARELKTYLFLLNSISILLILTIMVLYATYMIRSLTRSNKKLESKNNEIVEANKELDTLMYSISHDLRSPMTSIRGLINLLKDEEDPGIIKEYISVLDDTLAKQDTFILEIIDFFRSKRASLNYRTFSMKSLINDIVLNHRFTPLAQSMEITQQVNLDMVFTDELRLKMVLDNLVSNAIKYSDKNKAIRSLSIITQQQGNEIVIEVADNGVGIDKEHIEKIYDLFYVTSFKNNGTGLGLYILQQNIEKLGGRVEVWSELNIGTKFTVYIPQTGTIAKKNAEVTI